MRTHQGTYQRYAITPTGLQRGEHSYCTSQALTGCPVSPGIGGNPPSTQGPPLPDVSDAGDRGLVDNLRTHELRGAILAVLWLLRRQFLCIAKVTDPDLLAAQICHQEVFWLQDSAEQRGAWQVAGAFPRE